jgi:hypothetical protein
LRLLLLTVERCSPGACCAVCSVWDSLTICIMFSYCRRLTKESLVSLSHSELLSEVGQRLRELILRRPRWTKRTTAARAGSADDVVKDAGEWMAGLQARESSVAAPEPHYLVRKGVGRNGLSLKLWL